jgi:uncharacterized protein (DUF2267 family)
MTFEYEQFIKTIQIKADASWDEAERAAAATLATLAERLSAGEARDVAEELPPEARQWLAGDDDDAEGFTVDEFLRRVAEREGVDGPTAERHVRAVLTGLGQILPAKAITDIEAQLSSDYAPLMPRGPYVEVLQSERFLRRVADRGALPPDDLEPARRATEAVLETLAERIAGGEVDDLMDRLPVELHPPLKRGRERSGGTATKMSFDEFVDRVREREGGDVSEDRARDHARAVLLTLREAVGDDEFFDATVQLPRDYMEALALA